MSGMEMMVVSGVMSAGQSLMQMQQAKSAAAAQRQQAMLQAEIQRRQAEQELNRLEFQEKMTSLELGLMELQVPLKELETRSQVAAAKLETTSAMRDLLATIAAANASAAAGMTDLGLGPTIEALDIGLGDVFSGRDAESFARISGGVEAERMRSEITFGEASVDQLRNEQSFIRSTLPITTSAIISGGEAQARITEQAGITSALGTMGSFGMNAAQTGLFRSGTTARTGGRPLSRQIASYSSQRGGYL